MGPEKVGCFSRIRMGARIAVSSAKVASMVDGQFNGNFFLFYPAGFIPRS